jgi:antitoxin component of MazEF toxin-antitoxin module
MKFINKIWKTGDSHVITVPSAFIKFGQLTEGKEYIVTISELNECKECIFPVLG